ncbi:hypothetical protein P0W64_19500 [Tsukamurella sp. 8F]|uniref:hypothetical protein n=1 Tax=unclassified Tsukamurella TaxID=2633480 RepID=UPI0023B8BE8F|nr:MULTISPECIES: hypothetical protein [unclassified Tsukamurella]MDF0531727.1 hypothetical protein [Tsukamurella sp. 8J]MDF0588973.1 hypothetical protein [Tsukamurella sp. 8F]
MTRENTVTIGLGAGALAMGLGAFAGHWLAPRRVADWYGWPESRWYQREIGAFNAGLAFGVARYALGRRERAFVESWAVAAILLAGTRAAAMGAGDRAGARNLGTIIEDAVLGIGALVAIGGTP